jgi:molecular chaperone DnaK
METKRVYGIDLGTTYSCISYVDEYGKAVIIRNSEGDDTTPSVVYFENPDNIVVGKVAKNTARIESERVAAFVKRSMGDESYSFEVDGKSYSPQEISSLILRKLVHDAEAAMNEEIHDVVITCPAYFGVNQVAATMDAGKLAGLNVLGILREPVAAAISYGLATREREKKQEEEATPEKEMVLVYDLGGGTFDITLISIEGNNITVLMTGGDHELGGKDWDDRIMQHFAEQFVQAHPDAGDPLSDLNVAQDLATSAEESKKILTARERDTRLVQHAGQRLKVELTREKFEELTADLLERTLVMTQELLQQAEQQIEGYAPPTTLLLVGGSSKMPAVARRLKDVLEIEPQLFDPDLSVAKGAAMYASTLGLADAVQEVLREQGADHADPQARAAAIEAVAQKMGVTRQTVEEATRATVTMCASKAFGIKVEDPPGSGSYLIDHLIRPNTPLPHAEPQTYGTARENQDGIFIEVYEQSGKEVSREVENNTRILEGEITGLPPGLPAGSPVSVVFQLSPEGILEVLAREKSSNKELTLRGQVSGVMNEDELKSKASSLAKLSVT